VKWHHPCDGNMLDEKIVENLKKQYSSLHPLLFHRSVERAKSNGDLFDIVDTVPDKYPLSWNEKENRWSTFTDIYLTEQFLNDFNQ
jgi:hypothetical protein